MTTSDQEPGSIPGSELPSTRKRDWRGLALGAAGIVLLVFVAYWPALNGQFVWDDELLVIKNPLVLGQMNLGTVWFHTDFSLTTVVLWMQWLLWGTNPIGFHIVNVLLHAAGCLLLWRVLGRLEIPGAWLAAAIFAVHPVGAASVAWISEMKNTLSLIFCLASFNFFLRTEAEPSGARRGKFFYGLSLAAFLLALLSKTSTVMLPLVLLLCAWWRRGRIVRRDCLRTAPFFLVALLMGGATIWFQLQVMKTGDPVQTENFFARLAAAGRALWFYFGKAILPLDLCMIYPRWTVDSTNAAVYLPTVLWCALLVTCWWFRSRDWGRATFFAMGCFTVLLFPVLGFLSMDYLVISRVSDHFQYLPLIAAIALVTAAMAKGLPGQIFSSVAAMLVVGLVAMTFQRSEIISRNETLWRDTLAKNPESFTAHNNLGCILAAQNKLADAMYHFEQTLKYNSKNAGAHANLGRAFSMQHKFAEAEEHFQAALKIKPASADVQQSYAGALMEQGKVAEAIPHLREAVRLEPSVDLRLRFAGLLHKTGNAREAVEQYRAALVREPDSIEALNNLAWMLATSPDASVRNGGDAVRFAERACRLTASKKAGMVGTLAAAYAEAGRFTDAVATAAKAADLADADGNTQFAAINRQLLALYRAGKPFREPSPESAR
jgi:tetratricopeptide (TPR) repeat protein